MKALVSIHDVMPHTMREVAELLQICRDADIRAVTLLVVPGLDWSAVQLRRIRQWQDDGYVLAAHGWHHKCDSISTIRHRIHSKVLSRDVAEHLSKDSDQIAELMKRSGGWFDENGFDFPELYVPPAWALGGITDQALAETGFVMVETLLGVRLLQDGAFLNLPLVGFEADTALRTLALTCLNGIATKMPGNRPLRVSLHPHDHKLRLRHRMELALRDCGESVDYSYLLREGYQQIGS